MIQLSTLTAHDDQRREVEEFVARKLAARLGLTAST
jgi:hypothetical protein